MAIIPASSSTTPDSPFSDFLNTTNGKWESVDLASDYAKRAVILMSAGNYTVGGAQLAKGLTASGLYGILQVAQASGVASVIKFPISDSRPTGLDLGSESFVYDSPLDFVSHLNAIHNNINNIVRQFIPASTWAATDIDGNLAERTVTSGLGTTTAFNYVNNILFPGSYTGNVSTGVLPSKGSVDVNIDGQSIDDFKGKGITGAFVVYDQPSGDYVLSRTGIEFYTILTCLAYGAKVVVGDSYQPLAQFSGVPTNLITDADAFITLDMGTYLDGQGITLGTSESRLVYGGSENAYASGNTLNYCHGLTANWLNSNYTQITKRNNIVNSLLDSNGSANTKSAYIIHAGLSGAALSIAQNSITNDYSDVHRYPGFNGQPSLYQNIFDTAGLTAYTLTEEPYLNRLLCVMGKKRRTIKSANFGKPGTGDLILEIPLVADVAGALQKAKANNYIYQSFIGETSKLLNADSVVPLISPTSAYNTTLKQKRVNYYVSGSNGFYLNSDLVGATANSITIEDRIGVTSMKRVITKIAQDILNAAITSNLVNDQSTRNALETSIKTGITNNLGLNASLKTNTTEVTISQGATTASITATIVFYPIQISYGNTQTSINSYTLTVTAQD